MLQIYDYFKFKEDSGRCNFKEDSTVATNFEKNTHFEQKFDKWKSEKCDKF